MAYEITGHTVLTGLLGSPVAHSISPMMHNEAFRQLELDYAYLAFDVGTDNLKTAVDGLKVMGVRGFNLTMPDKNLMCSMVDKLSPASEIGGAVNTVVNDNGVLTGYTTDGIGFMRAVSETGVDIIGKKMTLLGVQTTCRNHHIHGSIQPIFYLVFSVCTDSHEVLTGQKTRFPVLCTVL